MIHRPIHTRVLASGLTSLWAALFLCLAFPCAAKIELSARVGFDSTYKSGGWTPLILVIENFPDPERPQKKVEEFQGEVQVTVIGLDGLSTRYAQSLQLAPNDARKRVEFSIMLPQGNFPILVELIDRQGATAFMTEVYPGLGGSVVGDQRREVLVAPTILLVTGQNENASFPTWVTSALNIRRIHRDFLPSDFKSYDGVDLVVLREGRNALSMTKHSDSDGFQE